MKISVLIPVFKEEKIIIDTVTYFKKLKRPEIEVYYITTNKEVDTNGKNLTEEKLKQYIPEKNIITYPYSIGDKSAQLNYAITLLKQDNPYHFFALFDADSRPDFHGFSEVLEKRSLTMIYQMVSVYNTNYKDLSLINKANAILQTRWSFYFEYQRLLNNFSNKNKDLMYLIGHGLFINEGFLKIFPLPESSITEDILYGYTVYFSGEYAQPLNYLDYCSVPNKFTDNIIQISRRFYGEFDAIFSLLRSQKEKSLIMKRLGELFLWGYGGLYVSLLGCLLVYFHQRALVLLFIVGIIGDFLSFKKIYNIYFQGSKDNLYLLYCCSVVKNILDAIPLSISIYNLIYSKLCDKKQAFIKTER